MKLEEFELDLDYEWVTDPLEYLKMFFIFDTVLENSVMDTKDALELFVMIQQESLQ